ncbi:MAG: hypothetical protein UT55_C0001G0004 [Candidatus Peregrinibacteria bacterium GW2011_GWE2_39_6]|nr:MAG: hypothetical protein UT36_C0005G0028 [Candidatus Peregrinibacteria bacterium GW2011_GWF2_39_17]KKR26793.1 MAG: hypothetical protein UT55_C0001G0004 [Candidatus Peregrinibacteria bacterium GW2011_GWE2_39_6]HCW32863.1 hypothetical protein [Candidatus Peregrinibacteria bacterium]
MNSKKNSYLLFLGLSLIFLTFSGGCFNSNSDQTSDTTQTLEYKDYKGTIQSLGTVKFDEKATHLLRLENQDIIYIYSTNYNLSDPLYLNQFVEAKGFIYQSTTANKKDLMRIDYLTVLSPKTESAESIIEHLYTNNSMGFALMTNSNWTVEETVNLVTFKSPTETLDSGIPSNPDTIQITTMDNIQSLPLEDWYTQYIKPTENTPSPSLSAIGSEKIPALKVMTSSSTIFYIEDETKVFIVTYANNLPNKQLEYSNLFAEIIYSFDLLSNGLNEFSKSLENSSIATGSPTSSPDTKQSTETTTKNLNGTEYQTIITEISKSLPTLIPNSEQITVETYEFVEPNYIYLIYQQIDSGEKEKILLNRLSADNYQLLAQFKEGTTTDFELIQGTDEAKGKEKTVITAASGSIMTVQEGYRWMESTTYQFQVQYPANWYYTRAGNIFYFSTQPATSTNSLVSLSIIDQSLNTSSEETKDTLFIYNHPKDNQTSFRVEGDIQYQEIIQTIGKSLTPLSN